ncbi:T9SS type A sorting domain-containing protein [Bacteroidota bacterium]
MRYLLKMTLTILLFLCTNHFLLSRENSDKDLLEEQRRAKEAFKYLMHTAHPLPDKNIIKNNIPILLTKPETLPIFLNSNMIEDEADISPIQNESSIAVNPLKPDMLIGSAVDYRANSSTWVYFSEDGGKTWVNYNLGKPYPDWRSTNDPSVAYDPDGCAYLVYGGFGMRDDTSHGESFGENGVFISVSTDGGKTWDSLNTHIPVIVHKGIMTMDSLFEDKYYISVDNSSMSPYRNHLYIPWKRITPRDSSTQIVLSKSTDKGRTWSIPLPVSQRKSGTSQDTTYGQSFPLVATGPNGEVYVVWNDGIVHGVGFNKSTDGGKSFSEPGIILNYSIFGITTNHASPSSPEPVWRHTLKNKVRAEAYPVLVVDTTESDNRGTLYLTWAADRIPNIYFSKSMDDGETWSEPVIVHSDTANDQFWQWMAVDPMNGDIAVMYLDSRDDEENIMVECYVSYSRDGGETWVDRKVSDFNSDIRRNPFQGNHFAGDYSGMAFYYGKIYPSWVDMRNAVITISDNDVFTALTNVWAPMPVDNFEAKTIPEKLEEIEISWDMPTERSFGQPLSPGEFHYLLYKENDTISLSSEQTGYIHKELIPFQKYHYKIYVIAGNDTSLHRADSAYAGGARELAAVEILSATGSSTNDIQFEVKLPEFRADMTTQLINLSKIILFDGNDEILEEIELSAEDAGSDYIFSYAPGERGYYNFYIKAYDDGEPQNESDKSNIIELYTGVIENNYSDNFDKGLLLYRKLDNWNITADFYRSAPNSLTDTPEGDYKNFVDNFIDIFPLRNNNGEELVLEFWHAAIVYKRDTAKIEISTDDGETWSRIAGFNELDYSYWEDGELNQQDWKYEKIIFPVEWEDTVIVRFSLATKLGAKEDGWYIDDLNIYSQPVSVEETKAATNAVIYPNPASNVLNLYIDNILSYNLTNIKMYSSYGREVEAPQPVITGNLVQFDISSLAQGVYYISLFRGDKAERVRFLRVE